MPPALAWLLQQIEADERTAQRQIAATKIFTDDPGFNVEWKWALITHYEGGGGGSLFGEPCASPARVLAECRAKRRQIEMLVELTQLSEVLPIPIDVGLCVEAIFAALFVPFADRPGYPL